MDFVAGKSNFDELVSEVVKPLVPNELNRSSKEDIRSPPRLPSPMSPRPDEVEGPNRDELAAVVAEEEVEEGGTGGGALELVWYEGVAVDTSGGELERALYD